MSKPSFLTIIHWFTVFTVSLQISPVFSNDLNEFDAAVPDSSTRENHNLAMVLAGSASGTVGFMVGAIIGAGTSNNTGDMAGLGEALVIGSIAGGLALPLGVHAGNRYQGDLEKVMGASIIVGATGWLVLLQTENSAVLPFIPIVQLVSCIIVENKTEKPNKPQLPQDFLADSPKPSLNVNLIPTRDGLGLFFSGKF